MTAVSKTETVGQTSLILSLQTTYGPYCRPTYVLRPLNDIKAIKSASAWRCACACCVDIRLTIMHARTHALTHLSHLAVRSSRCPSLSVCLFVCLSVFVSPRLIRPLLRSLPCRSISPLQHAVRACDVAVPITSDWLCMPL